MNLTPDLSAKLVIELGLEDFFNSDWFEVGVGQGRVVHRCIKLVQFGIFDVNEVDLVGCLVELDLKVDELQIEYRYIFFAVVLDRHAGCFHAG